MSRDALVATTVALLFAASIGGALWYRGYSLPIAQLASIDNVLSSSSAASQVTAPEASPQIPATPQTGAPAPNNAQPPLLPPAPPEIGEEKKEEPKRAAEKPAGKSVSKLPGTPAKKPVEKPAPPKGELAMPALPEGDLVGDVALPPVLDSSKPSPTKPSLPASEPNMPVNVPEQVAVPGPPVESKNSLPKSDLLPSLDGDKPAVAESPVPPAPPVVTAKSDALLPTVDDAAAELEAEMKTASKKSSLPAEPSLAEEPAQSMKSSLPKASLPEADEPVAGTKAAPLVPAAPVESKPASVVPPAPVVAETPAEDPVKTMPSPKLPTNDLKPVATATPTKKAPLAEATVAAPAADAPTPVSNLPKIPAPPSDMISARAVQTPSANGATLGTPAVPPVKPMTPSAPAPTAKDVIATAQPIKPLSPVEPTDPAAPLAQAKSTSSAAPTGQAQAAEAPPKPDEYLPLSNNHREYVPLGPGRPSEEFVSVAGGALPKGEVAYGGTSVVSHVRKTDLSNDQPKVISYDAKAYLTLEGDSFERIAETMYHTSGYGEALARYNRSRFHGDDVLPAGAKVRVPPMEVLGQQRGTASAGNSSARDAFQKVDRMPYVMSNAPAGAGAAIPVSNHPPIQPSAFDHQLVGAPAPEPPGAQYRAERNETLWAISKRHLGDGRRWREIYNLNRDRLASETQVPAGTTLRMPTITP